MAAQSLYARYVAQTPAKAARLAVAGLAADSDRDRDRARAIAVELRRTARCARCGRELRNKASLAAGVGPECRRKVGTDPQARREVRAVLEVLRDAGFPTLPLDELDATSPEANT